MRSPTIPPAGLAPTIPPPPPRQGGRPLKIALTGVVLLVAAQLWERADAPEPGVIALASDTDISALGRRALYSLSGLCQLVALPMSVHVLKVSRTRAVIALVLVAVWVALMAVNPWG